MLKDIVAVRTLDGHRLWLRFEDGLEGEVDVASLVPFTGVFAPLADRAQFAEVSLLPDSGISQIHMCLRVRRVEA